MTTIQRERSLERQGQPVFASNDGRRERVLKRVGGVAAVLVVLWLAALLAGAIGFGRLPGLPGSGFLQRGEHGSKAPRAPASSQVGVRPSDVVARTAPRSAVNPNRASQRRA